MFTLDEQLATDTYFIADLPLCSALLMNNALFPWVILVPREAGLVEITDLPQAKQHQLMDEIATVSDMLQELTGAQKMNIGALGNMVRQLHVHVIARSQDDAAWPKPVWGEESKPYTKHAAEKMLEKLRSALR